MHWLSLSQPVPNAKSTGCRAIGFHVVLRHSSSCSLLHPGFQMNSILPGFNESTYQSIRPNAPLQQKQLQLRSSTTELCKQHQTSSFWGPKQIKDLDQADMGTFWGVGRAEMSCSSRRCFFPLALVFGRFSSGFLAVLEWFSAILLVSWAFAGLGVSNRGAVLLGWPMSWVGCRWIVHVSLNERICLRVSMPSCTKYPFVLDGWWNLPNKVLPQHDYLIQTPCLLSLSC